MSSNYNIAMSMLYVEDLNGLFAQHGSPCCTVTAGTVWYRIEAAGDDTTFHCPTCADSLRRRIATNDDNPFLGLIEITPVATRRAAMTQR
jgi:hypothetical protein